MSDDGWLQCKKCGTSWTGHEPPEQCPHCQDHHPVDPRDAEISRLTEENKRLQGADPHVCPRCGTATWSLEYETDARRALTDLAKYRAVLDPDNPEAIAAVAKCIRYNDTSDSVDPTESWDELVELGWHEPYLDLARVCLAALAALVNPEGTE